MNKELFLQRISSLQQEVELGAGELNKLLGRIDEAKMWLAYVTDKESSLDNTPGSDH